MEPQAKTYLNRGEKNTLYVAKTFDSANNFKNRKMLIKGQFFKNPSDPSKYI